MREGFHIIYRILCIMIIVATENILMPTSREQTKKQGALEWTALSGVCVLTVVILEKKQCCGVDASCWDCLAQNLFWGNLLLALLQDVRECLVYRIIWLIILFISGFQILRNGIEPLPLFGALFYSSFQELIGRHFYGRADCHCFSSIAFFLIAGELHKGDALQDLVVHMLVSFTLLCVVSAFSGNLNRKGNLMYPVPFIPYIYFSLLVLLNSKV